MWRSDPRSKNAIPEPAPHYARAPWCHHAVRRDDCPVRIFAHDQVVAVLVELVGVELIDQGGQLRAELRGEDVPAQQLDFADFVRRGDRQGVPGICRASAQYPAVTLEQPASPSKGISPH